MAQQRSHLSLEDDYHAHHRFLPQNEELVHVSTPLLLLSMTPLILVAFVSYSMNLHLESAILTGAVRTFIQLSILGFILEPIFREGTEHWYIVILYCLFMVLLASYEASKRSKYTFRGMFVFVLLNLLSNVSVVSIFAFGVIIRPQPVWEPQYVIPIVGMLLGNCINGVSLALNNMLTLLREGSNEIDLHLAFGATPWEATARFMMESVRTGAMPQLNSMAIIGIISIPGMMTGQILGGASVGDAARYQMLIMYFIAVCAFGTIMVEVFVAVWVCFDRKTSMLRSRERLIQMDGKKGAVASLLTSLVAGVWRLVTQGRLLSSSQSKHSSSALVITGSTVSETTYLMAESQSEVQAQPSTRIRIETVVNPSFSSDNNDDGDAVAQKQAPSSTPVLTIDNFSKSFKRPSAIHAVASSATNGAPNTSLIRDPTYSNGINNNDDDAASILFQGLSCTLRSREVAIITGPSGSGKSTFLRMVAGLASADDGTIRLDGLARNSMDWTVWRYHVRYVPQSSVTIPGTPKQFLHKVHNLSVRKKVQASPSSASSSSMTFIDLVDSTINYLQEWNMAPDSIDKEWSILSGGEGQRMLLAIALASQPRVLLLDESTSALDIPTKLLVEQTIVRACQETGLCTLWISHDDEQIDRLRTLGQ